MRYFEIGKVAGAHGIRGDIKVFPITDDITRFERLKEVLIKQKEAVVPYAVEKVWYHKNMVMLKIKGIDDMNGALALKNALIVVEEKDALPLEENEYYIGDLYGLDVYTETGEHLGILEDILFTGANDVYVVKGPKEILIPAIKDCIKAVDIENKKMTVKLLKGLIEL